MIGRLLACPLIPYTNENSDDSGTWNWTGGGNHEEQMFVNSNVARSIGTTHAWKDDHWWDMRGNWIPASADYRYIREYLEK